MTHRPHVLISNDDGVNAPGLVALAARLREEDFCDFTVCGPSGERSAQSHSINIHKPLHAFPIPVPGAREAWAVDGTPADSVMLALHGPLLQDNAFDLVISGINRGDNAGLHIIYSGTVGAAREAACKGVPSVALSLDSYAARNVEAFEEAASHCVRLIRAVLGSGVEKLKDDDIPNPTPFTRLLAGKLLNINIPAGTARGYCVARQGVHCHLPRFEEAGVLDAAVAEAAAANGGRPAEGLRAFHNRVGEHQLDDAEGTDSWALKRQWIAVCPVGLSSDVPASSAAAAARADPELLRALRALLADTAQAEGLECLIPDARE